ncbi:hypothetical protein K431DRAFT_305367 [Polychaeton citri CBS 116435]|uniref:RING-type domain-containing protein n=1 Tax=Polychaeton citri CBS 116435 TaxID=1314669 RepID=A0A9P4Q264_9PEZI|nr:hypothetical protein K431DRAFT_305367 [Polychaeton citri CBS 116435]
MSRAQDQFIDDDEEETCPLCVEELDLTDRGFKPCPCGYQICQFCYNNVKNNVNGQCPACRRPYNDKDIEYKLITPEETAAYKAKQAQKQKKSQAAYQKERQKQEAETLSRKHLAGQRVVQKNLVYVTGLAPSSQEDQLLQTLRGPDYFGQYGKIIKIVVSKARDLSHPHSIGVYVTYERKEDAATCIEAVDGSRNGERTLRAQFGTTKYCSAYLRGDQCSNRNCMFLHEPGEANDSYSRADLSLLNARHTGTSNPPPQSQQPMASANPTIFAQRSIDTASPAPDGPALPSTASWASKPAQPTRTESRSTSSSDGSPVVSKATPAPVDPEPQPESQPVADESRTQAPVQHPPIPKQPKARKPRGDAVLVDFLKRASKDDLKFVFSYAGLSQEDVEIIENYPPLFDNKGGARKRLQRERETEALRMQEVAHQQRLQEQQQQVEQEESAVSGSMQLGGEPEERQEATSPPLHQNSEGGLDQRFQFGGVTSPGLSDRVLTPQQQHQQLLLQTMKSPNITASYLAPTNAFQQQANAPLGHQRNTSRYSFANDQSATTSVKPVANPKLMNQQSNMMPPNTGNHFGVQQHHGSQFFTSNVQGPPPGLKTTGTPPVSGGMTFGQGHGFATGGLQYNAASANRNPQEDMYNNLLRTGARGGSVVNAADKREFPTNFPGNYSNSQFPPHGTPASYHGSAAGGSAGGYANLNAFSGDNEKRQKKKGKKRHGNTSSSGGLDITDPATNHLLQARLHQTSGGGGAFGGAATGNIYNSVVHGGANGGYSNSRW